MSTECWTLCSELCTAALRCQDCHHLQFPDGAQTCAPGFTVERGQHWDLTQGGISLRVTGQQEAHLGSVWGESGISLATGFQASQKSLLKNSSRFITPLRYNSMCHITPIYIMCEIESPISYIIYCIIAVLVNFQPHSFLARGSELNSN